MKKKNYNPQSPIYLILLIVMTTTLYSAESWDLITLHESPFPNHYPSRKHHTLRQTAPTDYQWVTDEEVNQWYDKNKSTNNKWF